MKKRARCLLGACLLAAATPALPSRAGGSVNLAPVATPSTSFVSGHETLTAIKDGFEPERSGDKRHGAYGNWPRNGTQWVQYEWSQPVHINRIDVYWFDDQGGVRLPKACRLLYWDGTDFIPVKNAQGLGLAADTFNTTTFDAVTTAKLRLSFDSDGASSTGLLEWRVWDAGLSPNFPPEVVAGADRTVVLRHKTWLNGRVMDDGKPNTKPSAIWGVESGPGKVAFENAADLTTSATFSKTGTYVLRLAASDGQMSATNTLRVTVDPLPPETRLEPVYAQNYAFTGRVWKDRTKKLIVNWIPHCVAKIEDHAVPEGGINNFIEAGNKLAGRPHQPHKGPVFSSAWVYNTLESMCVALMVDPQGDAEILAAQKAMRDTIEAWVPAILSAQEPDGYMQPFYTLNSVPRWTVRTDHEGYLAAYLIEAAIAHHQMTGGRDTRLYEAAKKLADCWCANIGPAPKKAYVDGHQGFEMTLVHLARYVESCEGAGRGRKYVELAKFLMDGRKDGDEYDQCHAPVTRQYEVVGHAVRQVYGLAGMMDLATELNDPDYHSAVKSMWDNLVNTKYYVTGGVGSGESSEGFGRNFSLPNYAYCESCAACGTIFFQHKMNLLYRDARYADLYEETLFNALLGSVDLEAKNFCYTNPLDSGHARYPWHVCPCCVGNIPRTLLRLPTWMYLTGEKAIYVNLFAGSSVTLNTIAGTDVQLTQTTDYPWDGKVAIAVNPKAAARFALHIRVPNRTTSLLYAGTPEVKGIPELRLNGKAIRPDVESGYAVIDRKWKAGDTVEFVLPFTVQRVKADPRVKADAGRVALRYGPLVYCIESADQDVEKPLSPADTLTAEWDPTLLGGVVKLTGKFANGSALTAIPYYLRNNRDGRAIVWIKDQAP